ncbi:unnamed protein product [Sphagnum troendelagicum]|uniref:LisH domain-containing protein n=1 Tax=Sphagnum troendelagicum TaxID=128251 RepID=A0ABP0U909_9BRYO
MEEDQEELSKEELRKQLFSSLRSTGILDSLKSQLRARLIDQLRSSDDGSNFLLQSKTNNTRPSLTERLLSSLFLDYLAAYDYSFTTSVFLPESHLVSWAPFSYKEMLQLLHLDPSSEMHHKLKKARILRENQLQMKGEGKGCLAQQLVMVLQHMPLQSATAHSQEESHIQTPLRIEASTQTAQTETTGPQDLETKLKEIDDIYLKKRDSALQTQQHNAMLPYRAVEDHITVLHREFDSRVRAEVAMQVNSIREFEISAVQMEEAARFRRQLSRDREELEEIHKSRMAQIQAHEDSVLEHLLSKEKAIDALAYEQRQRVLADITSLRSREDELQQFKESQERREEKLDEREQMLRAKEEEVTCMKKNMYAEAEEFATKRRKELEEQYKEQYKDLHEQLHSDRTLLQAERAQAQEERVGMAIELASARSDKELIHALHRRLTSEEDQHLILTNTIKDVSDKDLEEKLNQLVCRSDLISTNVISLHNDDQPQDKLQTECLKKSRLEGDLVQHNIADLEQKQLQHKQAYEEEIKSLKQQLQLKEMKLEILQKEKEEWSSKYKQLLRMINELETTAKEALEEKKNAHRRQEMLHVQLQASESELLEMVKLLKKAQQALEAEQIQHYALRSRVNSATFKPLHRSNNGSVPTARQHDDKFCVEPKCNNSTSNEELDLKLKSNDMWSQLVHKYETSNAYIAHKKKPLILSPYPRSTPFSTDEKLDQELGKEVIELNLGTTHKLQIAAVKGLDQHSLTDVLDKVDQEGTIIKKVKDGSIQTDDDDTAAKSTAAAGITCIVKSETQCTQTEEEEQERCLKSWVHSLRQEVMMKSDDVLLCEEEVDMRITMLENRYTSSSSSSRTHVNENLPRKLQIQLHHDQNPGYFGEEGNPTAGGHGIFETSSVTAPQTDGLESRELHFSHDHASMHSSTKANLDCQQEKTVAQISSSSSKTLELQETEVNSMQSPKRIVTWERSQISGPPENIDKDVGLKTQNTIHQDRDAAQACELQLMSLSAQLEAGSSTNLKDINILPAAVQDLSELLSIHENTVRERFKQKRHEQQHTRSLKLADEKTPLKVQSFSSSGSSSVQGKNNNRLHIMSSSSSSRSSNLQSMSECQVVATPGNNKAAKNNPIGNLLQTEHDRLQQDVNTDNNSSITQLLGDKGSQLPGEQKPGSKVSIKVLSSCDINKVMIMPNTPDHMSPHGQKVEMGSVAAHAVAVVAIAAKASDSSPTGSSTSSKDSSALYKACSFEQEDEADEEGADEAEAEEAQDGTTYSEESCCNIVLRAPSIRSAAAGLGIDLNLHPEPISFINAAAAERVQPGDHHHGDEDDENDEEDQVISEWGIKSEQGSYSPTDDDAAATVDMCTTAAAAVHGETVCGFNLGKDQPNASK